MNNKNDYAIQDANFRDIYHRFQYIKCTEEIPALRTAFPMLEDADGIVTYCYVEEGQGTSFYIVASAKNEDGQLVLGPNVADHMARVRFDDVMYYNFCDQKNIEEVDWSQFDALKADVYEKFETKDELLQKIYNLEMLDYNRNARTPEYVSIVLQQEGLQPEYVFVRVTGFGKTEIYGELHQPPYQKEYGLEAKQPMCFFIFDYEGTPYFLWKPEPEEL